MIEYTHLLLERCCNGAGMLIGNALVFACETIPFTTWAHNHVDRTLDPREVTCHACLASEEYVAAVALNALRSM